MENNNNELYHYGVKGMKWGVKRAEAKLDRISKRSKKNNWSNDATEAAKIKTKRVSQMSNEELNKANNRKNLEENYKRLNPNALKKGLAIAGATAAAMGTIAALYTNGGKLIDIGKKLTKNGMSKYSQMKANSFWKEMYKGAPKNMSIEQMLNVINK